MVLTPVYLAVLIGIAKWWRNRHYPPGHSLRKYYLPGLYLKFGGAIFIALIYQYYYGFGDTFNYFSHSQIINSSFSNSLSDWWNLIRRAPVDDYPTLYKYTSQMYWYNDPPSYSVAVIAAVLGLFNGTSYIPIALLFAFFSYTGVWAMFKTFVNMYPKMQKQLAIAFLFIPSTIVWGSGIFKDTVCMFGLGWLTYCVFRIFVNKDFSLKNFVFLGLSFYLIATVKVYILIAFLPAVSFWVMLTYSQRVRSFIIRMAVRLAVVGILGLSFVVFSSQFSKELNKYSLENISKTAETTRNYIGYISEREGGSGYNLGEFDGSLGGMLSKFPAAVVVTLFRPFLWEAGKVIVFLSAVEALFFLYLTLKAFLKNGLLKSFKLIGKDPNLIFCLIFSLVFAFSVGISSYNFGALSRYKIPCLPFYVAFLVILLGKANSKPTMVKIRKAFAAPLNT